MGAKGILLDQTTRQELQHQKLVTEIADVSYSSVDGGFQVFSDFDDTLFCSGSVDRSSYRYEMYPGGFQFMLELAKGPHDNTNPSKIVPLLSSAATDQFVPAIKERSNFATVAKKVGETNGVDSWGLDLPKAQYAKKYNLLWGMGSFSTKTYLWDQFVTEKPSVFVGNNAQEDQSTAEAMATRKPFDRLQAAFIHDVRRDSTGHPTSKKIHLFDTYYDAAKKKHTNLGSSL